MVRPLRFRCNEQTAVNNFFQHEGNAAAEKLQQMALNEFDDFVEKLRRANIRVIVAEDTIEADTPDSIFPNNWVSFHQDGTIALYPMYAENRRKERRKGILDLLEKQGVESNKIVDFTHHESEAQFLEGTGSMVLDRVNRVAYAAISERTHPEVLNDFCNQFGYRSVIFHSNQTFESQRLPVYHTNVMMAMGDKFCVICLDSIDDAAERKEVILSLAAAQKEVIEITEEQQNHFAGNMLQVADDQGRKVMVMSLAAHGSLRSDQVDRLMKYNEKFVFSPLDTIERLGGGSARCMIAEVFLPKKKD